MSICRKAHIHAQIHQRYADTRFKYGFSARTHIFFIKTLLMHTHHIYGLEKKIVFSAKTKEKKSFRNSVVFAHSLTQEKLHSNNNIKKKEKCYQILKYNFIPSAVL